MEAEEQRLKELEEMKSVAKAEANMKVGQLFFNFVS